MDCTIALAPGVARRPRPVPWYQHPLVVVVSLAGGFLGILGAIVGELQAGGFLLLPFLGAPIIEEAFKPVGVYLALVWWPRALRSRLHVASLCAAAGIVFGLIESTIYVYVYAPDHPDWYPAFRFTIPVALHAIASFVVGLGLDRRVVDWVSRGDRLPRRTLRFYIAGVIIHAAYNIVAVALAIAGVFDF